MELLSVSHEMEWIQQGVHEVPIRLGSYELSEEFKEKLFHFLKTEGQIDPQEPLIIDHCSFVVWTSSALGVPEEGKCYSCVMVPGYQVQLLLGKKRVVVHTDLEADHCVFTKGVLCR